MARPYSISKRLIWSLSIAQVLALTIGTLGILLSIILLLPRNPDPMAGIAPMIAESVAVQPDGQLAMKPTRSLTKVLNQHPGLWAVMRLRDGRELRYGVVPPQAESLTKGLGSMPAGSFQTNAAGGGMTILPTLSMPGLGRADILFGGLNPHSYWLVGLFTYFRVIFIPLLIATVLTPTLVVPLVVRRVMGRMRSATTAAEAISFESLGERLPSDTVPLEVAPLVKAVNDALERLDVGQARRSQFLADAAHELRTPIAILLTRIEGLPPGPEREKILADVQRLADTAEQLLDVQRLEHAGPCRQVIDLVELARTAVADLAPLAIAGGYQLSFASEVDAVTTYGDAPAIERVLVNLIRNAIDHAGGKGEIRVQVRADRTIEIADDGPGVPEAHREEVFQPFRRVYPRDKGAGLGLTLVRQIVQRHGGQVSIVPQPVGALFRVTFPGA